jgi:hypothetical protein
MDPLTPGMDTFAQDMERRKRLLPMSLGAMASPDGVLSNTVRPGSALPSAMRARLGKVQQELDTLDSTDVDTTALQDFARQQGEAGQSATLNALAAQYAGESFQPVQAQFLKRAAAATEPMKIGAGMLTPQGQYIKDPFAARDSRRATLERQALGLEKLAGDEERAAQTRDDRLAQQEVTNDFRRQGLSLQERVAEMRRDMAANRPRDDSKTWRAEDNLRGDFDKLTKDLREELQATSKITQIISATPPGQKPDAITQQSLVILLNKFLDPGSVVREGEFDRVVKAQGLLGQAANLKDRILLGQPLDANTIKQIAGLAQFYSGATTKKIQSIANDYGEIARRRNLDVTSVISDPRFRGGGAPAGNAPAGVDPAVWAAMTPQERALWK